MRTAALVAMVAVSWVATRSKHHLLDMLTARWSRLRRLHKVISSLRQGARETLVVLLLAPLAPTATLLAASLTYSVITIVLPPLITAPFTGPLLSQMIKNLGRPDYLASAVALQKNVLHAIS